MKIIFEGYCDERAGWDFMAPLLLVKPVMQMHDVGSIGEAGRVIEDYIVSLSLDEPLESDEELDRRVVRRDFRRALNGSERFLYFRQEVEIPDDIDWESDDAFERITYGELQIGTTTRDGAGEGA